MPDSKPVALVIGASRGIGRQIAIDLAKQGYTVIVSAKSTSDPNTLSTFPPDPNSPQSTITTVAKEIQQAGGTCIAIPVDTRSLDSITALFESIATQFHRLDVLVYNSGAIWWGPVANTSFNRFRLMQQVNIEGLYCSLQCAFPIFANMGWKARVVVVCPPIYSRFFRGKAAYAVSKVGMSVLVKGLAMDWIREGKREMAITGLWPAVAIESAATGQIIAADQDQRSELRKPTIFSDAILAILDTEVDKVNGALVIDEDFLREVKGVTDFEKYSLVPGTQPRRIMPKRFPDLRIEEQDDEGVRTDSPAIRAKRQAKL